MDPSRFSEILRTLRFDERDYSTRYPELSHLDPDQLVYHFASEGRWNGKVGLTRSSTAEAQTLISCLSLESKEIGDIEWFVGWNGLLSASVDGGSVAAMSDLLSPTRSLLPTLMIGDSHAHFLFSGHAMLNAGIMPVPFLCTAASARGLANPLSKSGYGQRIITRLDRLGLKMCGRPIVFKFGQVDLEFVFDFQRLRRKRPAFDIAEYFEFIETTVSKYIEFLQICATTSRARIFVLSAFPPALNDASLRSGYANAQIGSFEEAGEGEELARALAELEMPDQVLRTSLHKEFNYQLEQRSSEQGFKFILEFDAMLNESNVIRADLVASHRGSDHHIDLSSEAAYSRSHHVGTFIKDNSA